MGIQSNFQIEPLESRKLLAGSIVANLDAVGLEPQLLTPFGSKLLFTGTTEKTGRELWLSDGTEAGTKLLKDITPGPNGTYTDQIVQMGNYAYFNTESDNQVSLWRTDGTAKGTIIVKQFNDNDFFGQITRLQNRLVFSTPNVLWSSDGTTSGTVKLRSFKYSYYRIFPENLQVVGNSVYFTINPTRFQIWRSDGTIAGTTKVASLEFINNAYGIGSNYYIEGNALNENTALWMVNPTQGLRKLQEFTFQSVLDVNGTAWFATQTNGHEEIWQAKGAKLSRIRMIRDAQVTLLGALNGRVFELEDNVLFTLSTNGGSARQVWDFGNDAVDQWVATSDAFFLKVGDYFSQSRGQLWKTDGIVTQQFGTYNDFLKSRLFVTVGKQVFFDAGDPLDQSELWITDGTAPGTHIVKDLRGSSADSGIENLVTVGDSLFFTTITNDTRDESNIETSLRIWRTDTNASEPVLANSIEGDYGFNASQVWTLGNRLLIALPVRNFTDQWDLWIVNPATGNSKRLAAGLSSPRFFASDGHIALFLSGREPIQSWHTELWSTDGSKTGTVRLLNYPEAGNQFYEYYNNPVVFDGRIYFTVGQNLTGYLWSTNGTVRGTRKGTHWFDNETNKPTRFGDMAVKGKKLYVSAYDLTNGWSLWQVSGGTVAPNRIKSFTKDWITQPMLLTIAGRLLYFESETMLYASDGTGASTIPLGTVPEWHERSSTIVVGNHFYLNAAAYDGLGGIYYTLFGSDGTPSGTGQVDAASLESEYTALEDHLVYQDAFEDNKLREIDDLSSHELAELFASGYGYRRIFGLGNRLFYINYDPEHGQELWSWSP